MINNAADDATCMLLQYCKYSVKWGAVGFTITLFCFTARRVAFTLVHWGHPRASSLPDPSLLGGHPVVHLSMRDASSNSLINKAK
jgi:hypothetical protein